MIVTGLSNGAWTAGMNQFFLNSLKTAKLLLIQTDFRAVYSCDIVALNLDNILWLHLTITVGQKQVIHLRS